VRSCPVVLRCGHAGARGGCSLEQILATVGREIAARPEAWREVIDGLRPLTTSLWQGLAPGERERFERELRVPWEVHAIGSRRRSPRAYAS